MDVEVERWCSGVAAVCVCKKGRRGWDREWGKGVENWWGESGLVVTLIKLHHVLPERIGELQRHV